MSRLGLDRLPLLRIYEVFSQCASEDTSAGDDADADRDDGGRGAQDGSSAGLGGGASLGSLSFARAVRLLSDEAHAGSLASSASVQAQSQSYGLEEFARVVGRLFLLLDLNRDRRLSFPELIAGLMVLLPSADPAERMAMAFSAFDADCESQATSRVCLCLRWCLCAHLMCFELLVPSHWLLSCHPSCFISL